MTILFLIRSIVTSGTNTRTHLDLSRLTAWQVSDAATKFAQWQVEFHWKIDTRMWKYLLFAKFMCRAFDTVILDLLCATNK